MFYVLLTEYYNTLTVSLRNVANRPKVGTKIDLHYV